MPPVTHDPAGGPRALRVPALAKTSVRTVANRSARTSATIWSSPKSSIYAESRDVAGERAFWMSGKVALVRKLSAIGGSYGDAVVILSAAISALAAEAWPGRGIDRHRFIELLARFSPARFRATAISLPLLVDELRSDGLHAEAHALHQNMLPLCDSQVLIGDDVDRSESEVTRACASLQTPQMRRCSYAAVFYGEVRSGYAHEFSAGPRADSRAMTMKNDVHVSYVNTVGRPRRIYFHQDWLFELAGELADAVDVAASSNPMPWARPTRWWIDG